MRISLYVIITTADARTRHQYKQNIQTLPATCKPYQHSFDVLTEESLIASTAEVIRYLIIPLLAL